MVTVAAVLASLVLVAIFAARHAGRRSAALIAPSLCFAMPVAWVAAGGGAPQVVLVPFVLIWLLAFDQFYRTTGYRWLAFGGAALALMVYLHLAGLVLAPAHFVAGACVLAFRRDRLPALAAYAAGFAALALPKVVSGLQDSSAWVAAINAYGLYDANRFNVLQGIREVGSWVGLTARTEVYWDSLNPALLFLGKGRLTDALFGSQVFLLPLALPFARGLFAYLTQPRGPMDWLVLGALLVAPLASALLAQPPVAPRLILLTSVAAIIATRGCYSGALSTTVAGSPATPSIAATSR